MSPIRVTKIGLLGLSREEKGTIFEGGHEEFIVGEQYTCIVDGTPEGGRVVIVFPGDGGGLPARELLRLTLGQGDHVTQMSHTFEGYTNAGWDEKFIPPGVDKDNPKKVREFRPVSPREELLYQIRNLGNKGNKEEKR